MSIALKLYHHLPSPTRTIAASMRGYYLRWWRYDGQTDAMVEAALERDYWTDKEWKEWTERRLSYILHRAANDVPFYREMWSKRRRAGDKSSWEYLENWPVLEKRAIRENSRAFIADDCDPKRMFLDHTSGTTGTSLNLWSSRETLRSWYALSEARWRRWYGVSRNDRWAILGGQLVTPVSQARPPFWVWNAGLKQLYMSSYHLAPQNLGAYLRALKQRRVRYVIGYTSALYSLAQAVQDGIETNVKFDVVITNAEPVYEYQRELISEAFGCPVMETYGMAEMVAAASECSSNSLHHWPESGVVKAAVGDSGDNADLICTGLVNADMPLVRYRVGDSGQFSGEPCKCGRTLPVLKRIEGRSDDLLFTTDGRRIGRLDPVFKDTPEIVEAQIEQASLREIRVRYVPRENSGDHGTVKIAKRLQERMGDVHVTFEQVNAIKRTPRGKFRAVICNLTELERSSISERLNND